MLSLLYVLIIGFAVGALAKFVTPGRETGGFLLTTLLGVIGSVLAHYAGLSMGLYAPESLLGFLASVLGAVVVLAIGKMVTQHRSSV